MRSRSARALAVAAALLAALACAPAPAARAATAHTAVEFTACPDAPQLGCATLTVPLDPTGATGGTLQLAIRRRLAGATPTQDAVVGLAGGPGQAALPLTDDFARSLAPALGTRDLIVFDQRGTGSSDPLNCPAFNFALSVTATATLCAQELGPRRTLFTTAQSVADIEAIRAALGYQKLVLYGTSYGTKVALDYALAHPTNVESLVLDSVVGPAGPDVFQRSSFAAVPRVLNELCSAGACRGITANALGDLTQLIRSLQRHPLQTSAFDARGVSHRLALGRGDLFKILLSGDENPELRAAFPGSVRSALRGDGAPLGRLAIVAASLAPDAYTPARALTAWASRPQAIGRQIGEPGFNHVVNVDTTCEELSYPWLPKASLTARIYQALAAARAIPPPSLAPFDNATALATSPAALCLGWPDSSSTPPAPPQGSLNGIPTLILSGSADLRTPIADAQALASAIPGAQVIVVPHNGHSVVGTDLTPCSGNAIRAFFAGQPAPACVSQANVFPPTPLAPTRLGRLHPTPGVRGRAGRTLAAVAATLADARSQVIAGLVALGPLRPGEAFGGLRHGRALVEPGGLLLSSYGYVPGVYVSGLLPNIALHRAAVLDVTGPAATHGHVTFSPTGHVSGSFGGTSFELSLSVPASLARAGAVQRTLGGGLGSIDLSGRGLLSPLSGLAHVG